MRAAARAPGARGGATIARRPAAVAGSRAGRCARASLAALGTRAWIAVLALLFAGAVQRHAEAAFVPSQKDEYSVKAAFLYKFAAYVRWPKEAFEDEKSPVIVAVLGADPFGRELDEVFDKKTIQGRSFVLKRYGSKDDVGPCHILFVAKSENARLDSLIETYRSKAVLVIADTDDYAKRGGTMGFALVDKKVRFTINAGACKQARLDVSSQLLKLATVIGDKSTE